MIRYATLPEDPSPAETRLLSLIILLSLAQAGRRKELLPANPVPRYTSYDMRGLAREAYCEGGRVALGMVLEGYGPEEILRQIEVLEAGE